MCVQQIKFRVPWKRGDIDAECPKCCINLGFAANNIIKHLFHSNILGIQHKNNKISITNTYMCKSPKVS